MQAENVAGWFRKNGISFEKVYSSPLRRAVETAGIISGSDAVETDERLIEMDYGPYEGYDVKPHMTNTLKGTGVTCFLLPVQSKLYRFPFRGIGQPFHHTA